MKTEIAMQSAMNHAEKAALNQQSESEGMSGCSEVGVIRSSKRKTLHSGGFAIVLCLAGMSQALAQQYSATSFNQGQLVSPAQGITFYGAPTVRTYNIPSVQADFSANVRPLQIRVLARGLGALDVTQGLGTITLSDTAINPANTTISGTRGVQKQCSFVLTIKDAVTHTVQDSGRVVLVVVGT